MSHLLRVSHLLGEIIFLISSLNRPPEHQHTHGGNGNAVGLAVSWGNEKSVNISRHSGSSSHLRLRPNSASNRQNYYRTLLESFNAAIGQLHSGLSFTVEAHNLTHMLWTEGRKSIQFYLRSHLWVPAQRLNAPTKCVKCVLLAKEHSEKQRTKHLATSHHWKRS